MKYLITILFIISIPHLFAQKNNKYESYLQAIQKDLDKLGLQINPNATNPFITGSALQNYFLNEKVLLLERDAYFMMKSNKLETTEEVADYQHRLKVLAGHAQNILLGLVRSIKNQKEEGFSQEANRHQIIWEELLEKCKNEPSCVTRELANGKTIIQNDLIDSFSFSLQISEQIPYMHALEFSSIYQLVQLLYLETMLGYARVSKVEFNLFIKKQTKLIDEINDNRSLTIKEKEFHKTVVTNTINKWKKKILERKFDDKNKFTQLKNELIKENKTIISELKKIRSLNPEIIPDSEVCRRFMRFLRDRKKCELRMKLEGHLEKIGSGQNLISTKDQKLPASFWEQI